MSLVAILSIYREGGILKRLRATPLRPYRILSAHVIVKLLTTLATVMALMLAGKRYFPEGADVPYVPFALAVLFSTLSILSIGFIVASVVPTARFAQPVGTLLFYPMVVLSGLFFPISVLPSLRADVGSLPAGELRRVADERDMARRGMGGAHGRSGGAGRGVPDLRDASQRGCSAGNEGARLLPKPKVHFGRYKRATAEHDHAPAE